MAVLKSSHGFGKWMILWGLLVIGHVVGLLLYCGLSAPLKAVWQMPMLPINAVVVAAIGPLAIVLFFLLVLFRVQGGTVIAISSLACGTPLLYWALFLFVRKWLKSERHLVQWLLNIALVCYSALSTFTLLFGASRI